MPDNRPSVKPTITAAVSQAPAAPAPIRDRVVIENGTIATLAGNPAAVKEFPFLGSVRDAKKGCGGCGTKNKAKEEALAKAKKSIAGLADDRRRLLLGFLGARSATVVYRTGEGVAREVELT